MRRSVDGERIKQQRGLRALPGVLWPMFYELCPILPRPRTNINWRFATSISSPNHLSSFIAQRISKDGKQRGPWCLFSGENGTSLAVTRSLGDADAARCCISIPEIVTYRVKRGEDSRVIICSDGVWDTLSSFQVFKRALRRTPAAASKRISNIVKERRYNNGLGRDDITVFIIDIFPIPRPPGCSPTCAIM